MLCLSRAFSCSRRAYRSFSSSMAVAAMMKRIRHLLAGSSKIIRNMQGFLQIYTIVLAFTSGWALGCLRASPSRSQRSCR